MRCVKEDGKYICEGVTSSCCFFSENCRNTRTICNSLDAHLWATDIAKITELTKLAQDRGDDLDNANELLTIAEEKAKEQTKETERLRECLREADKRLDDVLRTLKSESHAHQIIEVCEVIEAALGETTRYGGNARQVCVQSAGVLANQGWAAPIRRANVRGCVPCAECGELVVDDTADDYLADGSGPYCSECYTALACPVCGGTGEVSDWREYLDTCPACKGQGRKRNGQI